MGSDRGSGPVIQLRLNQKFYNVEVSLAALDKASPDFLAPLARQAFNNGRTHITLDNYGIDSVGFEEAFSYLHSFDNKHMKHQAVIMPDRFKRHYQAASQLGLDALRKEFEVLLVDRVKAGDESMLVPALQTLFLFPSTLSARSKLIRIAAQKRALKIILPRISSLPLAAITALLFRCQSTGMSAAEALGLALSWMADEERADHRRAVPALHVIAALRLDEVGAEEAAWIRAGLEEPFVRQRIPDFVRCTVLDRLTDGARKNGTALRRPSSSESIPVNGPSKPRSNAPVSTFSSFILI